MIEVNIVGQLGNQLFEYACARQIQEKYGGTIILNTYEMSKNTPNFRLALLDFKLNDNVKVISDQPLKKANADKYTVKFFRKMLPNIYFDAMARNGIFIWKSARIYKALPSLSPERSKDIILNGYWQSEKYFENVKDVIREEFTPKEPLRPQNRELYNRIIDSESVCVTIRRGDFMNEKNKGTFYICDEQYFQRALNEIKKYVPNCTFFGFSDDVEWVKNNIEFPGEVFFESGNDPVWEKLRLMAACKHFVLSNSSFSWWAQYLSESKGKIVVAPDRWYKTGKHVKPDFYQNSWKLIHIG